MWERRGYPPPCGSVGADKGGLLSLPLLAELQRRRVFRALIAYGIAAFAVLQIVEPVMHGLHWPESIPSYVVLGLAAGFPVVVALAWIFDVNAGRIERTVSASPATGVSGREWHCCSLESVHWRL